MPIWTFAQKPPSPFRTIRGNGKSDISSNHTRRWIRLLKSQNERRLLSHGRWPSVEFKHEKKREFSREANALGIRSGVTIPVPAGFGHMSLLTFASSHTVVTENQTLDHGPSIAVASLTHAYVSLRHPQYRALGGIRLTTQEATCLRWAAEGKSMDETARLLEIRYTTVRAYLDNAREKLGGRHIDPSRRDCSPAEPHLG